MGHARVVGLLLVGTVLAAASACVGDAPVTGDGGTDATTDVAPDVAGDAGCGDTQTDPNNCGSCGHVCPASSGGCFAGVCGNAIVQIAGAASEFHVCALTARGDVYCWGNNSDGQLGVGSQTTFNQAARVQKDSTGAPFGSVKQIAVGNVHTCALKNDGTVWCWGQGAAGELGDGVALPIAADAGLHDVLAPQKVPSLAGFKAIASGGYVTCGLDANDAVWCWGSNDSGSLGHQPGTTGDQTCTGLPTCSTSSATADCCNSTPKAVSGATGITSVAVGTFNVVTTDGVNVKAWGKNDYLELASADAGTYSYSPVTVALSFPTDTVYAGREYHCARKTADVLTCWGRNDLGMIATGDFTPIEPPVLWGGGNGYPTVSAGLGNFHSCIVTGTQVKCSGANDTGQLGTGTPPPGSSCLNSQTDCVDQPQNVAGLPSGATPVQVIASDYHPSNLAGFSCARMSDGTVYCWGDNTVGELGTGNNNPSTSAVQVVGLP